MGIISWICDRGTYNSRRYYLDIRIREFAAGIPAGHSVLDAGAGACPYAKHFTHARYESADFCQVDKPYAPVTYVCDLRAIPVKDESFDFILFSQVIEHLPEPVAVLKEFRRILKPGGKLFWSGPLYFDEHEKPYDFYRYTQFGFREVMLQAGFRVDEVSWLEGYFGTVSYQFQLATRFLPGSVRLHGGGLRGVLTALFTNLILRPLIGFSAVVYSRLDRKFKYTETGHCTDYCGISTRE